MTIYIALLRGINVGGNNMIKMADLKRTLESIGLGRVQTYIQSGNVLFESIEDETQLRKKIESQIESVFGLTIPVIIRTAAELEWIVNNCPFSEETISEAEASSEGECLYVSMLLEAPTREGLDKLHTYQNESEEYRLIGRELYLLFHNSIRNSKLANNLPKLGVHSTNRNWKTMNKLVMLSRAMSN
jgi:uncharacterized protein (DUF1697 family)